MWLYGFPTTLYVGVGVHRTTPVTTRIYPENPAVHLPAPRESIYVPPENPDPVPTGPPDTPENWKTPKTSPPPGVGLWFPRFPRRDPENPDRPRRSPVRKDTPENPDTPAARPGAREERI
jgi:hypothetical protein